MKRLLADFLATLPRDIRCAFEFRHASWLTDGVYGLLEKHGVALCLAESEKLTIPKVITSGFVYSRLRMPEYSPEDRKEIAERVQEMLESGHDVYVFFKHEETPAGRALRRRIAARVSSADGGRKLETHSVFVSVFLAQHAQVLARFAFLVGDKSRSFELMIGDGVDHGGDVRIDALLSVQQFLRQISRARWFELAGAGCGASQASAAPAIKPLNSANAKRTYQPRPC